jgi:hypothetical protein
LSAGHATGQAHEQPARDPSHRFGLIDEHYRYVVPDGIAQPTGVTEKDGFLFAILERAFALGANEDLE